MPMPVIPPFVFSSSAIPLWWLRIKLAAPMVCACSWKSSMTRTPVADRNTTMECGRRRFTPTRQASKAKTRWCPDLVGKTALITADVVCESYTRRDRTYYTHLEYHHCTYSSTIIVLEYESAANRKTRARVRTRVLEYVLGYSSTQVPWYVRWCAVLSSSVLISWPACMYACFVREVDPKWPAES